jgi:hypothetical protein
LVPVLGAHHGQQQQTILVDDLLLNHVSDMHACSPN